MSTIEQQISELRDVTKSATTIAEQAAAGNENLTESVNLLASGVASNQNLAATYKEELGILQTRLQELSAAADKESQLQAEQREIITEQQKTLETFQSTLNQVASNFVGFESDLRRNAEITARLSSFVDGAGADISSMKADAEQLNARIQQQQQAFAVDTIEIAALRTEIDDALQQSKQATEKMQAQLQVCQTFQETWSSSKESTNAALLEANELEASIKECTDKASGSLVKKPVSNEESRSIAATDCTVLDDANKAMSAAAELIKRVQARRALLSQGSSPHLTVVENRNLAPKPSH